MKRTLLWIITIAMFLPFVLTLTGCTSAPSDDSDPGGDPSPDQPPSTPELNDTSDTVSTDDTYAQSQAVITDYLNVFGRTPVIDGALTMFWTNSGFSFAFHGTGVRAKLNTSTTNQTYYGYLNVYIDGATTPSTTICVDKSGTYILAEELPVGDHTIEVRKRNEAIYGDSATISLKELTVTDGKFRKKAPDTPKYTIEFIGDSITSGFGNMVIDGGGEGANFSTHTQDGTMTYATIAARATNASATVLSRSGICYLTGSDRDSMYPYYIQTAALPGKSADTGYWSFEENTVDVVVINLGTNDTGARINGQAVSYEQYKEHAVAFLQLVRANNPKATIIWAYGMITESRGDAIAAAVNELANAGDYDVYYCALPTMDRATEGVGVHGHPDALSHLISAVTLADFLEENAYLDLDHTTTLRDAVLIAQQYLPADHETLTAAAALLQDGCDSERAHSAVLAIIDACKAAFSAQ